MPSFIYKATDAGGKVVTGTMEAALEKDVVARLHGMNLIPIRVAASRGSAAASV
jgi:type II secretory pathway component PulF